jgi:hypothetical protein
MSVGIALTATAAAVAAAAPSVGTVPPALKLSPFYAKYVDAAGLPVVASAKVPDEALLEARDIAVHMLEGRDDVRKALAKHHVRIAVMASTEVTSDIPEHADLNHAFPQTDWDKRCRGVGATWARPASSAAEENLLAEKGDRYRGESIMVHEFGHTVALGVKDVDRKFAELLKTAYDDARQHGLWDKTYAATNPDEYWAEGVQDWFDTNAHAKKPNGIHNEIHTRAQLKEYDPALAALMVRVFGDRPWRCPYGTTAADRAAAAATTRPSSNP